MSLEKSIDHVSDVEVKSGHCETHGEYQIKEIKFGERVIRMEGCPKCADAREAKRAEEEAERERKLAHERRCNKLSRAGLSVRTINSTFENYVAESEQQKYNLARVQSFVDAVEADRAVGNLMMVGSVGTGKTHLAAAIVHEVSKSHRVRIIRCIDMIRDIKATWSSRSEESEREVIDGFCNLDVLIIDEVGIQFGSDTEKMLMFDVLNGRYDNCVPTVLISNLDHENLKDYLGAQVVDRLREDGGSLLAFNWESHRGKK